MKKILKGLFLGLLVYLVALVVTVPVRLALAYVPMPPNVRIVGVDGTVWRGNAGSVQVNAFDVGQTSWSLDPLKLLTAKVGGNVSVEREGLKGDGIVSANQHEVHLEDTRLTAEASVLQPYLRALAASVGGVIDVKINSLIATQERLQTADGTMTWRNAQIISPASVNLGELMVEFQPKGEDVEGNVKSSGGVVIITGKVVIKPGWSYQLNLRLKPTANAPPEIRQGLAFIGKADNNGVVNLRRNGRLQL